MNHSIATTDSAIINQMKPSEYNAAIMFYMEQARRGPSVVAILSEGADEMSAFIQRIPDEKIDYAYASGKWTVGLLLQHIIDEEKMMSYKATQYAKGDTTNLWRYQEFFTPEREARQKSKTELLYEFQQVRKNTIALFSEMSSEDALNMGSLSGNRVSVRGIGLVIAGHERHHHKVLQQRYHLD